MTHTLPLIHKYRFLIAILLTAFVSISMIAFKIPSPTSAQAATETNSSVTAVPATDLANNVPLSVADGALKTLLETGQITATGKITFPRSMVTTTPAPKKVEPEVKKPEETKPDAPSADPSASAAATTADPATKTPAAPATTTKARVQTESATAAQTGTVAPVPANTPAPSSAPVAAAPIAGTSPAAAQAFARTYIAGMGMGDSEFQCLVTLWNHESGWNFQATNSSSGAYGIPQSLPGSKMASAGVDWQTNPQTQIKWGVSYITGRYGTPCGALSAWNVKGWY